MQFVPSYVGEMFQKYCYKRKNIFCCLLGGALAKFDWQCPRVQGKMNNYHVFFMLSVRETCTDRLVNKYDVRNLIPRPRIVSQVVPMWINLAWT